jgi:hypothetical protein
MDTYQAMLKTLSQSTTSNKARLKVFVCLIIGVIKSRSVNLSKLASLQNSDASEDSQTRWAIEVLFGHLKKKGIDLESTHLRDRRKIDKLLAVVSLAFLFT